MPVLEASVFKTQFSNKIRNRVPLAIQAGVFIAAWILYAFTVAPGTLFGDPSEYQFIPAILGIAHPPGYAFYTLVAGLWQRLFVVGSVALRTNLLAATSGAWVVSRVAVITYRLSETHQTKKIGHFVRVIPAIYAALLVAVAPDLWQHSIHANAHVMSVALTMTQVWLLIHWAIDGRDWSLYLAAFTVGLGVTHHPITVWGIPAYAAFVLIRRPKFFITPRLFFPVLGCGLLGLAPWLYFPLRSPHTPFGPTDMATLSGFIRHATAQGLRGNLFHFGWGDQWNRIRVFLSLTNLQYFWPLLVIALAGIAVTARRNPRIMWLLGLFLIGHLAFTMNSVQDVMAYLLHPFAVIGVFIGLGTDYLLNMRFGGVSMKWGRLLALAALVLIPVLSAVDQLPKISLRTWYDADAFVESLLNRFTDQGEGAAFVSDWEHLTPLYYHLLVEDKPLDPEDLRPVFVSGAQPWPESVFANLPKGPVYLPTYRREIRELGFRLRPQEELWRVLEPPAETPVNPQYVLNVKLRERNLEIVGYDLPTRDVQPGGSVPLVLYTRVMSPQDHILMPFVEMGGTTQRWTTDSRRLTPDWIPGEVIAERYRVYVPFSLSPGGYALQLGYTDMTANQERLSFEHGANSLSLGDIAVRDVSNPAVMNPSRVTKTLDRHALVNIGNDVALMQTSVRVGGRFRSQLWKDPVPISDGQPINMTLTWRVLQSPRTSYTIFIHVIDATGRPWFGHDYTPLGGAFPSYLWFPKWLAGQQVRDPYRLELPDDLPGGQYWLEVGMYEMGTVRRIPQFDASGNIVGDRLILGPLLVE